MRRVRLVILSGAIVIAVGLLAFVAFVGDGIWHAHVSQMALDARYGPSEHVLLRTSQPHCPFGYAGFAFLAQGPRIERLGGNEATGYVCSRCLSPSLVHEQAIDPADHIDWD